MRRIHLVLFALLALFSCAVLLAQNSGMSMGSAPSHIIVTTDQIKWTPGPPGLPAGCMMCVLDGDPGKAQLFTIRAKMPANYNIPAHWHSIDEHITVLSGGFYIGAGDKLDKAAAARIGPGDFTMLPAKMHHFAASDGETIIQIHGMGPFDIT